MPEIYYASHSTYFYFNSSVIKSHHFKGKIEFERLQHLDRKAFSCYTSAGNHTRVALPF